jgi:hypothetical protein
MAGKRKQQADAQSSPAAGAPFKRLPITDDVAPPSRMAQPVTKVATFPLSPEEHEAMGAQLAQLELEEKRLKADHKDARKELKEEENTLRARIETLATNKARGAEDREGEVLVDYDYDHKEVRTYDAASKACIERRTMTTEEAAQPPLV